MEWFEETDRKWKGLPMKETEINESEGASLVIAQAYAN